MKLETTISPRRDGTVNVDLDNSRYSFVADESGALVCDVENQEHATKLLCMGDRFFPADDADFEAASALVSGANTGAKVSTDDDDDEDEDEDEPVNMNAAPIEEPASAVATGAPAEPKAAKATGGRKKAN